MTRWNWWRPKSRIATAFTLAIALLVLAQAMPQLLFFPYSAQAGTWTIRSDRPISTALPGVIARADGLLAASPINQPEARQVFLTDGGWRWQVLALNHHGSFGLTRPGREAIIINSSDVAADVVRNGDRLAGRRRLSGVLAHEACHGLLRARYGLLVDFRLPAWKKEGYCDHVARESSLDDATAQALLDAGDDHPALVYWQGRRKVAAALARSGGNVDAVMTSSD